MPAASFQNFRTRCGKVMMELIGTGLLLLIIQLSLGMNPASAPLIIGLGLTSLVYSGAPISGAHYNPAVSLAFFLRGSIALHDLLMYSIFQVMGAIAGALLGGIIAGNFAPLTKGPQFNLTQAFLAEFVFTALLCFVVLAVVTNGKVEGNSYYAFAIGLVVFVGAGTVGPISGAAFNPAVAVGLGLVNTSCSFRYILFVSIANLAGAIAGTLAFYLVAPDIFESIGEEAQALLESARVGSTQ